MTQNDYIKTINEWFEVNFIECKSSNIVAYAYDDKNKHLIIAFKGGLVYQYQKVDKHIFDALKKAESKGKFVNEFIVRKNPPYKFVKYKVSE